MVKVGFWRGKFIWQKNKCWHEKLVLAEENGNKTTGISRHGEETRNVSTCRYTPIRVQGRLCLHPPPSVTTSEIWFEMLWVVCSVFDKEHTPTTG